MKAPDQATSASQQLDPDARDSGLLADSVQLGWAVLTSGWTALIVAGVIGVLFVVGGHVEPRGASFKELLATHDFATSRALHGLGINDAPAGWLTLLLYLVAGLNAVGLFLRYGLGLGGPLRRGDNRSGVWVSEAEATLDLPVHDVVKNLPRVFSRTPRRRGSGVVTTQRGLWDDGWVLVIAGAATLLASIAVDRGSAFEGRVTLVPDSRQVPTTEFRSERGDWLQRPSLGLLCLPADPADPTRTRACRLPAGQGQADEGTVSAGTPVILGNLKLEQVSEIAVPALIDAGRGPSLLLRQGAADAAPKRLEVAASGNSYRVDAAGTPVELTSFFGPDGPFVVARAKGGRPVLMTPALSKAPSPVPGTGLFLAGIPWWRVEFRATTDPGRYLRYTGLGLILAALLVMLLVPHVRVRLEPHPEGGRCLVTVRSSNRRGLPATCLTDIVRSNEGRGGTS